MKYRYLQKTRKVSRLAGSDQHIRIFLSGTCRGIFPGSPLHRISEHSGWGSESWDGRGNKQVLAIKNKKILLPEDLINPVLHMPGLS